MLFLRNTFTNLTTDVNRNQYIREEVQNMKFEEALLSLRNHKILARTVWEGKWLELKNGQLIMIIERSNSCRYYFREMNFESEDILAEDWTIVNRDSLDIKQFFLSVNDLKSLGISQTTIDELIENQPTLGAIEINPRKEHEEKMELLGKNL